MASRTRDKLVEVVRCNPLANVAVGPKRYQVTFLAEELAYDLVRKIEAAAVEPERVVVIGRELYAWHPVPIADRRSRLWALLAGVRLGVTATSRNWTTVRKLFEMSNQ